MILWLRSVSLHLIPHVAKRNDVRLGRCALGFAAEKLVCRESAARAVLLDGSDDFGKVEAKGRGERFDDIGVKNTLVFFSAQVCVCGDKLTEMEKIEIKEEY